jgi:hypothetical protein
VSHYIYVADSSSSSKEEDTLEIKVECQFTSISPNRYSSNYQKTLILSAHGLNDFALGRLVLNLLLNLLLMTESLLYSDWVRRTQRSSSTRLGLRTRGHRGWSSRTRRCWR